MNSKIRGDAQPTPDMDDVEPTVHALRRDPHIGHGDFHLSENCEVEIDVTGHRSVRIEVKVREKDGKMVLLDLGISDAHLLGTILIGEVNRLYKEGAYG